MDWQPLQDFVAVYQEGRGKERVVADYSLRLRKRGMGAGNVNRLETLLAPGYKAEPYWWERTPRPDLGSPAPPTKADVAIVGSGFTGLAAAIQTAGGGRHTVVLDSEDAGWGCSSRNGGQLTNGLKPSFEELAPKYGRQRALDILMESHKALDWTSSFIAEQGIDCDFRRLGRFHAAHNATSYREFERLLADPPEGFDRDAFLVPRHEQRSEIGSDFYHGGMVYPQHASVDPAVYHQGLLEKAMAAGSEVVPQCAVTDISPNTSGFTLTTSKGDIRCRDLILATSGYTGAISPWQRRRIIPIGSYMLATEALPPEQVKRLIPNDRVVSDTRKLVVYYRTSPDGRRILFGGRVSINETDPTVCLPALHAEMVRRFPELESTKVTHAWMGFVGYTFDTLPHLGRHDGIYYAMGYCGSGVALSGYMGARIGQQLLGLREGRTALDGLAFQTRPFYHGKPWFLPSSIWYYRWRDEQDW